MAEITFPLLMAAALGAAVGLAVGYVLGLRIGWIVGMRNGVTMTLQQRKK